MKKPITVRVKKTLTFDETDVCSIAKDMSYTFWNSGYFEDIEPSDIDDEDFAGLLRAVADEFQKIVEEDINED